MKPVLYHNPRCSKSRETLALLEQRGVELNVVHYLDEPPDVATLKAMAAALDGPVSSLVRPGEAPWQEAGLSPAELSDDELFEFIARHPRVLQRPVLVVGNRARIGRPPERVLEILDA